MSCDKKEEFMKEWEWALLLPNKFTVWKRK